MDGQGVVAGCDQGEGFPGAGHRAVGLDHVSGPAAAAHSRQQVPVAGLDAVTTEGADQGEGLPGTGQRAVGLDRISSPPAAADRRQVMPVEGLDGAVRRKAEVCRSTASELMSNLGKDQCYPNRPPFFARLHPGKKS